MCEDIQADVEDGQLQFFYILAFVLQGDTKSSGDGRRDLYGETVGIFAKYLPDIPPPEFSPRTRKYETFVTRHAVSDGGGISAVHADDSDSHG